jgi:hypothetical protein
MNNPLAEADIKSGRLQTMMISDEASNVRNFKSTIAPSMNLS